MTLVAGQPAPTQPHSTVEQTSDWAQSYANNVHAARERPCDDSCACFRYPALRRHFSRFISKEGNSRICLSCLSRSDFKSTLPVCARLCATMPESCSYCYALYGVQSSRRLYLAAQCDAMQLKRISEAIRHSVGPKQNVYAHTHMHVFTA